jgi:hypothetical protein
MPVRFLLVLTLVFTCLAPAYAEPYSQKQLESWIDNLLNQLRKSGAENASRGTVSYDPASGKFYVTDIKVTLPEKVWSLETSTDKSDKDSKDAKSTISTIKSEPLVFTISRISADGLTAGGSSWNAAKLHIESLRLGPGKKHGALVIDSIDADALSAPQIAAEDFGKTPTEKIVLLLQQTNAKNIIIPRTLISADETTLKSSQLTLGELRLSDIMNGKAKLFSLMQSTGLIKADDFSKEPKDNKENKDKAANFENADIKIGSMSVEDFDLGLYADVFLEKPNHAGQKNLPFYSKASFDGASLQSGDTFNFILGAMKANNARINIPEKGLMALAKLINDMKAKDSDQTSAKKQTFNPYGDWMSLVTTETFESSGFKFKSPDAQMEVKSLDGEEVGSTIGKMAINGFYLTTPDLKVSFDSINLKKIDTATFWKTYADEMMKNPDHPDFKVLEGKLPTIGLIEVNNIALQSKGEPSLQTKRIAFGLESWVKFIPQHFYFTIDGMVFPANAFPDLESPNLKDLGYEKLQLNSDMQFNYSEGTKIASFAPVKFDFTEAGNMGAELKLSDIDASKLDDVSAFALQMASAKFDKLAFQLSNGNFFDRYIAWKAKNEKKSDSAAREEVALGLKVMSVFIPDEVQKKKANEAIDAFVAHPKSLTVTLTPKSKLSLLDLQLGVMANQIGLLSKVNFDVIANQGGL